MDQNENRFYREASPEGGHAFPQHGWTKDPETRAYMADRGGMSLRAYIATRVMAALAPTSDNTWDADAKSACRAADALLRALNADTAQADDAERMRAALLEIANGATGYLDNDTTLANIAKRALGMEIDE